ncbi:NAD-dependent epimerase [Oceaniferula spumae]|uniref:NAD-dependent epimerase n=1 Tax=Oceaniferula spumae TaxID=2979115 RepID=A0AAT9FSJ1_9BACT
MKKLIIAGANGFLARYLTRYFTERDWEVVGLARHREGMDAQCRYVHWDGETLGDWAQEMDGADFLVNLAGRSVNCRYNESNKRLITESRVNSTRVLGEAIAQCTTPPELWINSSTATIYRHAEDRPQSDTGEIGDGFSVGVAKAWEEAFFGAKVPGRVRKVAVRTSMVLADEPGTVYRYLYQLARFGLGGKVGSGKQMVSWIHIEDFCRAIDWLIEHDEISGPINVTSPDPLPNAEVMRRFRKLAGRSIGLPASKWMAEIGAFLLRTETELILKSRWVVPTRLLEHGFVFNHPEMEPWKWRE